jgi:hypothetical protein
MGLYVYAVGEAGHGEMPVLQGIFEQPAYRIQAGSLYAVVSECPVETVRAERRHIAATQRILATLNAKFDILPMTFGTISKEETELRLFLDEHRETLESQLQRIAGAVEMSLRVTLDVPDPIAYLVERSPTLRNARERTFGGRRPPSHDARIRLGQMFNEALGKYREAHTTQIMAVVGAACAELISLPVRDEKDIVNLAALVVRSEVDRFEAAVDGAAAQIDEEIAFTIGGPWPPHNFTQFDPKDR